MDRVKLTSGTRCDSTININSGGNPTQGEWIVLLHGLFATRRSMNKLERRLSAVGYQVVNWGYRTLWRSTEEHVQQLLRTVRGLQNDANVQSISFVTHSMGGILARCALHYGNARKIKRIVMLAPPNSGSQLTRISLGPFSWCCPTIADLSESPDSLPNRLTNHRDVEFGVIAALRDFVVPLENTRLPNQRDHCVIPTTHFQLPNNEAAVNQVLHFLSVGSFGPTNQSPYRSMDPNSIELRAAG